MKKKSKQNPSKYKKIKTKDFDIAFEKGDVSEYLDLKSAKAIKSDTEKEEKQRRERQ